MHQKMAFFVFVCFVFVVVVAVVVVVVVFLFPFILAVTLSGANNEPFRGLLVQGRQVADATPIGVFSAFTTNTRASSCMPAEVYKIKIKNEIEK